MNRIRELREKLAAVAPAAYSVPALARRLGVTEGAVRRWESGQRIPRQRHARALARDLGVKVEDLGLAVEEIRASANGGSHEAERPA